jgi:D-3-phosphoglycerate dehydrogenase
VSAEFRVGVTRDVRATDGSLAFGDLGLDVLDDAGVPWEFLPDDDREIRREHADAYDALVVFSPRVTRATVDGARRLRIAARLGVGYDSVDVGACTANGVLVTITPDGVRRPMAAAAMAFVLALAHRVLVKDRLVREGRWHDRFDHLGIGLTGRTLGILGLGNIGRDLATLAAPFAMRLLAHDPFVDRDDAVELVSLETLLRESDFLVLTLPLSAETRHVVNAERLALMKPTAFLVNVARGPLVDEAALLSALRDGTIAGAGLDVYEEEPIGADHPLCALPNVVLAPHSLGHTDETFLLMGRSACESILAVREGRVPRYAINPEAARA